VIIAATIPDALTFAVAAIVCVAGAFGVVLLRNPVHAALSLVATLFGVAVLFVEQDAQFLAAVQVIVYAGAIVVLFLFVIMLLGVDRKEAIFADKLRFQRTTAGVLGVLVLVLVLLLAKTKWPTGAPSQTGKLTGSATNVADLGKSVFTTYLLPFEITSALLVIAVIGAVALSRRPPRDSSLPQEAGEDVVAPSPDDAAPTTPHTEGLAGSTEPEAVSKKASGSVLTAGPDTSEADGL
jgi:NADH-quinone oxidoreductase subunit J